jgi:chromodomain-helicase-DNA-binding protein 7
LSLKQKLKRFDQVYEEQIKLKRLNANFSFDLDYIDDSSDESLNENQSEEKLSANGNNAIKLIMKKNFFNPKMNYINFDQNTLKVDRVVGCSEMFDLIHPKKALKIMSKWSDSILKVIQILINFRYQNVIFTILFI